MIEHDPPLLVALDMAKADSKPMIFKAGGFIAIHDETDELRETVVRQSSRIAFLEAALETALAAQTELRALNSELGDENYELRHLSPKEQSVMHNALRRSATLVHKASLSESLSRALRLPNTPDPYGR